jgi:hypothetical protein
MLETLVQYNSLALSTPEKLRILSEDDFDINEKVIEHIKQKYNSKMYKKIMLTLSIKVIEQSEFFE